MADSEVRDQLPTISHVSVGVKRTAIEAGLEEGGLEEGEPAGAVAAEGEYVPSTGTEGKDGVVAAPSQKRAKFTPEQLLQLPFRKRICEASRDADLTTVLQAYEEMLAKSVRPTTYMYNVILSICTRVVGPVDASLVAKAVRVFDQMQSFGVDANESAFASMIRICSVAQHRELAHSFLGRMLTAGIAPRLRSYSPLLQAAAAAADFPAAAQIWRDMHSRDIVPTHIEFTAMLQALSQEGRHAEFLALLQDMSAAEYSASPPLLNVLQQFFGGLRAPLLSDGGGAASAAVAATAGASLQGTWRCGLTSIDPATGLCPLTHRRLRSLELDAAARASLLAQVEGLAGSSAAALQAFAGYRAWLAAHGPFDVIVDGANVGFCNQNYAGAGFKYTQVDGVVRWFQARGKRVLLVLSRRWLYPQRSGGGKQSSRLWKARSRADGGSYSSEGGTCGGLRNAEDAAGGGSASDDLGGGGSGTGGASSTDDDGHVITVAQSPEDAITMPSVVEEDPTPCLQATAYLGRGAATVGAVAAASVLGCSSASPALPTSSQPPEAPWAAVASTIGVSSAAGSGGARADMTQAGGSPLARWPGYVAWDAEEDGSLSAPLVKRWLKDNIVYTAPPGTNDDWYWMFAALSAPNAASVQLVSNDQMRDHHYQMLAPRTFLQWRERHQVNFGFKIVSTAEAVKEMAPGGLPAADASSAVAPAALRPEFSFPRGYSHRIQAAEDGRAWHFPVQGTPSHWLVAWRVDGEDQAQAAEPAAASVAQTAVEQLR